MASKDNNGKKYHFLKQQIVGRHISIAEIFGDEGDLIQELRRDFLVRLEEMKNNRVLPLLCEGCEKDFFIIKNDSDQKILCYNLSCLMHNIMTLEEIFTIVENNL